jgi:two-component system, LytTR family, sensor kinase
MRLARRILLVSLIWLLVASVFVAQNVVAALGRHEPISWMTAALFEVEYWCIFLVATPFFVWMARRYRFEPGRYGHSVLAHVVGGLLFACVQPVATYGLHAATLAVIGAPTGAHAALIASFTHRYAFLGIVAFWKYGVVIAVCDALAYQRQASQFARAQLSALRMQIHPHFLFNALHSASVLALSDPESSHRMLIRIADLLRESLDSAADAEVTLSDELEFIDRYLAIEQVRFDGRLSLAYEVSEAAERALVPSFILQPLIENAVHHVFARHSSARLLVVRAAIEGTALVLDVEDDGPGLPAGWRFDASAGTGLRSVQARIDLVSHRPRTLQLVNLVPTGLRVRLVLDCRYATREAA